MIPKSKYSDGHMSEVEFELASPDIYSVYGLSRDMKSTFLTRYRFCIHGFQIINTKSPYKCIFQFEWLERDAGKDGYNKADIEVMIDFIVRKKSCTINGDIKFTDLN